MQTHLNYWIVFFGTVFCIAAAIFLIFTTFPDLCDVVWSYIEWVLDVEQGRIR